MELWVRSQDKLKLVKVNYIYMMESNDHFTIYGETIDSGPIIATYKTKERALEVLDEIQKSLCYNNSNDTYIFENGNILVYEMPED